MMLYCRNPREVCCRNLKLKLEARIGSFYEYELSRAKVAHLFQGFQINAGKLGRSKLFRVYMSRTTFFISMEETWCNQASMFTHYVPSRLPLYKF